MSIDLDRITHPLRLARGSHEPGSGKGCAMNVISYINGDAMITDFPECSARPLARLVQMLNDRLAGPDGFLSPENSVLVLDLGWKTVGTADTPKEVVWQWVADILIDRVWGVVKYAGLDSAAVRRVADLCQREAAGIRVDASEWYEARTAGTAVDFYAAAFAANGCFTDAAERAEIATLAAKRTEFTRWAIDRWRELAGLDETPAEVKAVNAALDRMYA